MAYPKSRSCRQELHAGMTDGGWKKANPNRGGICEDETAEVRRFMDPTWHGFNESRAKMLPDGRLDHPPYYENVEPISKDW